MGVTYDGGETAEQLRGWGGDNHDMWVDPTNASRLMIGNDLGVMISTTRGREWSTMRLPVGQIYHVATTRACPTGCMATCRTTPRCAARARA